MGFTRNIFFSICLSVCFFLPPSQAHEPAIEFDSSSCSLGLQSKKEFFDALPERLKKFLSNPAVQKIFVSAQQPQAITLETLLNNSIKYRSGAFVYTVNGVLFRMSAKLDKKTNTAYLDIPYLSHEKLILGTSANSGKAMAILMMDILRWANQLYEKESVTKFVITGKNMKNEHLKKLLKLLGFIQKEDPRAKTINSLYGGATGGALGLAFSYLLTIVRADEFIPAACLTIPIAAGGILGFVKLNTTVINQQLILEIKPPCSP